jgi:glucose-1-phosphate thymidylyltransferase
VKGVILAGGLGTRLLPLTKITNKHLLPVYDKPMIYYPLEMLVQASIDEVMIVTGGNYAGDFLRLLGNGKEFGLKQLQFAYQEGEGGIAEALGLTRQFADGEKIVAVLGDNLFENSISAYVKAFKKQNGGARIFLKEVPDPQRFGVPCIEGDFIVKIEEKPQKPQNSYAVAGLYMYDATVYDIIQTLKPSDRGELEITDVNNAYINRGAMSYDVIDGWWSDAGTIEALYHANTLVAQKSNK